MKTFRNSIIWLTIFAISMAFLESVVVVYLRKLYYPNGFTFPLVLMDADVFVAEFFREASTVLMLISISAIAMKGFWKRFAYFMIAFGVWDIFYYVWLKVLLNWPLTFFDWDVLFLIPVPWIGPVIAPMIISLMMISCGLLILRLYERSLTFKPTIPSIILAAIGITSVLFTFMLDTNATMHFKIPQPYWYWLFVIGIVMMSAGFVMAWKNSNLTYEKLE